MTKVKMQMRSRMTVVMIGLIVLFLAVVCKLAYVQFIQGDELRLRAENQRTRDLPVAASRGTIYDVNGNKLAISISADTITVSPVDVQNADMVGDVALFLSDALDMPYDTIKEKLQKQSYFEYIQRKVDYQVAELVEEADLPGVNVIEETKRYYPNGELAAQVLGFVGIDNNGLEGIEYYLEDELSGDDGRVVSLYDSQGRQISSGTFEYMEPRNGYTVYVTLDSNVQYFAERALDEIMAQENPPTSCGIIIMQPKTGALLAMAYRPGYDPNFYSNYDSAAYRNGLISDVYEPGSTFKIITLSTALEEGTISESDRFYDPGYINVADARIGCWRANPHGSQSFREAVQNSCNPAFIQIQQTIEAKESGLFHKYITAFGFGSPTGIELPGEASGLVTAANKLGPVELATMAIGQGIAVTPLQLVTAVSAVANDGVLLKPQIISRIEDENGDVVRELEVEAVRQVISADTAATVRSVLESVVTDGTAHRAYIEGYRVGGKTGTAQKAGAGGYQQGKYVSSFIGMAPVDDPEIVALVYINEPYVGGNVYQGGQIAAPVFQAVISDTLRYLGITPQVSTDEQEQAAEVTKVTVPDVTNLSPDAAAEVLALCGLKSSVSGTGSSIASQAPASYSKVALGTTISIVKGEAPTSESSGYITVPDLTGKRLSAAAELLSAMGLKLQANGASGVAAEQWPAPGARVTAGSTVGVSFAQPSDEVTGP
ncbi:MAG: PASTA domain-containing protein [Firmicutes bacterium]|nr:PASTA domain-containing protein [Bacillota bacterium]